MICIRRVFWSTYAYVYYYYLWAPLWVCMDVWMHGCMDVWMYGCMDVWMYGYMDVCMTLDVQVSCMPLIHSAVDLEAVVPSIPDCASLSVKFPDGCHVADCSQAAVEVVILLEFCSSQPITLTGHLIFRDTNSGKKWEEAFLHTYIYLHSNIYQKSVYIHVRIHLLASFPDSLLLYNISTCCMSCMYCLVCWGEVSMFLYFYCFLASVLYTSLSMYM